MNLRRVRIAGLPVDVGSRTDIVEAAARIGARRLTENDSRLVAALHVGGLLARKDSKYRTALDDAEIVTADGASVVLLARTVSGLPCERSATTDIAIPILRRVCEIAGRPARIALVGGTPGLADAAAQALKEKARICVVYTSHGYHDDWSEVLTGLSASRADVLIVGLGSPAEVIWVREHRAELTAPLVLTCGGWFGFLAGQENRAPDWAQRSGLEWLFRLAQSPRRLFGRYARGVFVVGRIFISAAVTRAGRLTKSRTSAR